MKTTITQYAATMTDSEYLRREFERPLADWNPRDANTVRSGDRGWRRTPAPRHGRKEGCGPQRIGRPRMRSSNAAPLRLAQNSERHDDPQPNVRAIVIALAAHLLHHLARLCHRPVAVALNPGMRLMLNVEIREGHAMNSSVSRRRRKGGAALLAHSTFAGGIGRKCRGFVRAAMAYTLVWLLSLRSTIRA